MPQSNFREQNKPFGKTKDYGIKPFWKLYCPFGYSFPIKLSNTQTHISLHYSSFCSSIPFRSMKWVFICHHDLFRFLLFFLLTPIVLFISRKKNTANNFYFWVFRARIGKGKILLLPLKTNLSVRRPSGCTPAEPEIPLYVNSKVICLMIFVSLMQWPLTS